MDYSRLSAATKYFLLSRHKRGHGIHSPFVYDIINTVFLEKIPPPVLEIVNTARKYLRQNNDRIYINDLGTGSAYTSSAHRRISAIARRSPVSNRYGRILYNLALMNNGNDILELGTSLGISAMFLSLGAADSNIITIEGCSSLVGIARGTFESKNIGNITVKEGDFEDNLLKLNNVSYSPSLVFVDGNHSKEPVLRYFSLLKKLMTPDSVIVFDDINYSFGMSEAWNEIKSDPQVSVSIDIFRMGLVFFRTGMVKQDFIIRY